MLISVDPSIGLPALAALVLGESAGLPIPGETALIVSGGLAHDGQLSLPLVIATAAIAAMIGDMLGYWVGRRGGRKLLLREGRFSSHRHAAVAKADKYFERYGLITVFFARFVPGVRVVGAVAAGTTQMRFRSFAIANAGGCWAWATTVGTIAYLVGPKGAIVMIILGFTIGAVGVLSAVIKTRRDDAAEAAAAAITADAGNPLEALATVAKAAAGGGQPTTAEGERTGPTPPPDSSHADLKQHLAGRHGAHSHAHLPGGVPSAATLTACTEQRS